MAEKLIPFSMEITRRILAGNKTQLRRVVKNIPLKEPYFEIEDGEPFVCIKGEWFPASMFSPMQQGDTIWVQEQWARDAGRYLYRLDYDDDVDGVTWSPSVHMPHDAARIFLHVTSARMERLQDISIQDIKAEGVEASTAPLMICDFKFYWDSTIRRVEKYRYGWEANPWVYVVEFKRVKRAG